MDVYKAISRVGERITHLAPTILEWDRSFSTTGMMKAPVLPEPVLAIAMTLKPCRSAGIAFLYIGVGILYPFVLMALSTSGAKLYTAKAPPIPPSFFCFVG